MKLPFQSRAEVGRAMAMLLIVGAMALPACQASPATYGVEYPPGSKQGKTLDIQVVRRAQRVTMTNTTAINFGPSRLWLNRRFSLPIDGWKIGETLDIHLSEFADEFGERFRPGGFFAAEAPDKIVYAQIESLRSDLVTPEADIQMLGLIVVTTAD